VGMLASGELSAVHRSPVRCDAWRQKNHVVESQSKAHGETYTRRTHEGLPLEV
jgi:hypothetical protein